MTEWIETTVRDVVVRCYSGPSPTCEERNVQSPEEWGLLKTTAVTWAAGWDESAHKVPPRAYWNNKAIEVHPGDILITKAGPRHRVGVVVHVPVTQPRLMVSGKMIGLTPNTADVVPRVLAGVLATREPQKYLDQRTTGMAESQVNFANETLLSAPIRIPPIPEQRRIAEILVTIDDAIRSTEGLIAKLELIKQGLLHDLLARGVDDNGQLRDPLGHPEQFVATPIGLIPRAWSLSNVHVEFDVRSGITLGPERAPGRNASPYLRVANVYRGRLALDDVTSLEASATERAEYSLRVDDLLVVEGHASPHEIGRCAIVTAPAAGFLYQNHLFRLRAKRIVPQFAELWLNSPVVCSYWYRICSSSSGLNTINSKQLRAVPVAVPLPHEQEYVVHTCGSTLADIRSEEDLLGKLRDLRAGLMADLLTGRVRVKVDEDAA